MFESMASTAPSIGTRHFLSVLDLSSAELMRLLDLSARLKSERSLGPRAPTSQSLASRHVAMLFEKPSLRTRSTFEIAVHELGGHTLNVPAEFGDGGREPVVDIVRNLERWVHGLVVRTFAQEKVAAMAAASSTMHVVNALSDQEHPCQALADMLTLLEHWSSLEGRVLTFVGDGNNVATSLAHAAVMLGVSLHVASPPGYELPAHVIADAHRVARAGAQVRVFTDPFEAVRGASAIYTDVWTSMGQEREATARRAVFEPYQVNARLMAAAGADCLFMHCLPAHRGEEVSSEVVDSPSSVIFDQAENRLHTQKALLLMLLS